MDGQSPMLYKSAYDNKEEAEAEVKRLQDLRDKENEASKTFVYKQRGDAFMRPQFNPDKYWIKIFAIQTTTTFLSIRDDTKDLQNNPCIATPPIQVEGMPAGAKVKVTIELIN